MTDLARILEERWTYGDYKNWPEDERWELIDGEAYLMSAPSVPHQRVVLRFSRWLGNYLEGNPCEVFIAPFDVLSFGEGEKEEDECSTVVQPDLLVVCDKSGLNDKNLHGLPELVVEILSPSTSKRDQNEKFTLYEKRGVREYWVVDPLARWVCLYGRDEKGAFARKGLREKLGDMSPIASTYLEGFSIDPEKLFAEA